MDSTTCRNVLRTALMGGALDPKDAIRSARAELGGLPLVLNAMSSSMGCKIRVRHGTSQLASTDGKNIDLMHLPIPTDRTDIDSFVVLLSLAYGLGYHELGHVSESDFKVLKRLGSMRSNGKASHLVESFFRIIEDVRMETAFIKKWPNTRKYLDSLTQSLLLTGFYEHVGADAPPMSALSAYLLYRLYHDYRGDTGTRELAIEARAVCEKLFSDPVITRLDALLPQMRNLADTSDSLTMARNLAMFIEKEKDKQEKQNPPPKQNQSPTQGNGAGSDQQQSQSPDQGDADDDDQQQAGNGGQAESDQDAEGDQDGNDGQTQQQSHGGSDSSQNQAGQSDSGSNPILQALQSVLDPENADPCVGERADVIRAALNFVSGSFESDNLGYIDVSNEGCVVDTTVVETTASNPYFNPNCKMDEALAVTTQLRRSFKKTMQTATEAQVSLNRRGRKLSASHLHRVAGGDNRIFKSVSEEIDLDTAVTIALDRSFSMNGDPIQLTCEAVYATAVALEGIEGVSCSAVQFPGNKILLPFGSKAKARKHHFAVSAGGGTPTDEAIYLSTRMLLSQRRNRRILVIVTDGAPDSPGATVAAAEYAKQRGIEVYVLAIGSATNVCNFENWHPLQDIQSLPSVVTQMFTRRFKRAA